MTTDSTDIGVLDVGRVSGRFLTDLFRVMERHDFPATRLLGDLPLPLDRRGAVAGPVDWWVFAEFLRRLEQEVGGPEGVERWGHTLVELRPTSVLRNLAGLSASPHALYRGGLRWALPRALPGVEAQLGPLEDDRFEARVRLVDGLRACPQVFHFGAGGARALPRLLGMADAVVDVEVGDREAVYRIALPPSQTMLARLRRRLRSLFSPGAVLQALETQQLELHAQHEALQRAHAALAASEQRYRSLTEAAVDVLCEIDAAGRLVYVSASIHDLIGYSPEQVTGSHYRLWIPRRFHPLADARFEAMRSRPAGVAVAGAPVSLHVDDGREIVAEISVRSYETQDGEWRMVGILRDWKARYTPPAPARPKTEAGAVPDRLARLTTALSDLDDRSRRPAPARSRARGPGGDAPLVHSLERLLAALRAEARESDPARVGVLVEATQRMTRIVNGALFASGAPAAKPTWSETRKLVDLAREGFARIAIERDLELVLHLEHGPARVWGQLDRLVGALASLLERAAELAPVASTVRLDLVRRARSEGPGIGFAVRRARARRGVAADAGTPFLAESGSLLLAIAQDAAALLDGGIELEDEPSSGDEIVRLWLPQPARNG